MTQMITHQREQWRGKSVLLFSGGMDSLCMSRLLTPDILLCVDSDTPYSRRERQCIEQLIDTGDIDGARVIKLDGVLRLSRFERDDAIVPNRNAHLVLLASHYGETVFIGAVSGDRSTDKDDAFCALMSTLLDHMWQEQHWTERRTFNVAVPFKRITKTRMVAQYLARGGTPASLLRSFSCYEGGVHHCGQCKPCFRKWVALTNNDIELSAGYFTHNPWEAGWLPETMNALRAGTWRGAEDREILNALEHVRARGLA
ncbi:7-cyano-7-deazaguanine synthase [Paraburkholderia sp. HD33-4]|uniref:7-cyano-7-deazaguanine synthase n=1 Tax=Paraburkholderia sp. HD33-4 TaxID=2883242 RepID=UPI001F26E023|nr:7-cyano-7-deazaguanine synthase [Paraburkholderia sp. HD33-4]